MSSAREQKLSYKQASRMLFAQVDSLKESLYSDLLVRFKQDRTIGAHEQRWKLAIMVASVSTALFSQSLKANKEYISIFTYFNIKMKEFDPEGEAALENCLGLIADLMSRANYDPLHYSETIALWLYFFVRGKDELAVEETAPYMLVAQFIHNHFFNWFEGMPDDEVQDRR